MSSDPKNRQMNDREWAEYMATRKSTSTSGPSDQLKAAPHHIAELQLDSALRAFAGISNDTGFVNEVMEKVAELNSDVSSGDKSGMRLPTIDSASIVNSDQDDLSVPENRMVTIAPRDTAQTYKPEADQETVSWRGRVLVLASSCLVVAAAIAVYCLVPNSTTDQLQIVGTIKPPAHEEVLTQVENSNDATAQGGLASDRLRESLERLLDHSPSKGVEKPKQNDLVKADQPADDRTEALLELQASNDQKKKEALRGLRELERALRLLEHRPPPETGGDASLELRKALEAKRPSAAALAEERLKLLKAFSDKMALGPLVQPATPERLLAAPKPEIDSDVKTWNLKLSFDADFGGASAVANHTSLGSLTINGALVSEDVFVIHSLGLLRSIGKEASKRLAFLQPRIGKQIGGSITIWNQRYKFDDPAEIEQIIEEAVVKQNVQENISRWVARTQEKNGGKGHVRLLAAMFGTGALGTERPREQPERHRKIRESVFAPHQYVPTLREVVALDDALIHTESFLRLLAKDWDHQVSLGGISEKEVAARRQFLHSHANESQISDLEFRDFVFKENELVLPIDEQEVRPLTLIQHLSEAELKDQLREITRSYDLFADVYAFNSAVSSFDEAIEAKRMSPPEEAIEFFEPLEDILLDRPDLKGLPLVMGKECRLNQQDVASQASVSQNIGSALAKFDSFGNRGNGSDNSYRKWVIRGAVKECCETGSENPSKSLATLDQMMQIDHTHMVIDVVSSLRETKTDAAIELIAMRAKFDLRPEVRFSATQALKEFPKEKYRAVLLEGIKYPWHVVAQHSAEALVRLDDKQAVPELIELLRDYKTLSLIEEDGKLFQQEVVAVNHLKNCLLCHAPSTSPRDPSRGLVPDWERPLSKNYYNGKRAGLSVRADITYLTQDFSVLQTVDDPGFWPSEQRVDYMVYKKLISKSVDQSGKTDSNEDYKKAIVFALQSLTGKKPQDNSWENWRQISNGMP